MLSEYRTCGRKKTVPHQQRLEKSRSKNSDLFVTEENIVSIAKRCVFRNKRPILHAPNDPIWSVDDIVAEVVSFLWNYQLGEKCGFAIRRTRSWWYKTKYVTENRRSILYSRKETLVQNDGGSKLNCNEVVDEVVAKEMKFKYNSNYIIGLIEDERLKFIVIQNFLKEKTLREISKCLNVSDETVRTLRNEAIEFLRAKLNEEIR